MAWRRPAHLLLLARVLGHGHRGLVAFTSTAPFFCCRGLVQIQESVTEMAEDGKKRPGSAEAEDRAIKRFLVELPGTFPCAGGAREAEG